MRSRITSSIALKRGLILGLGLLSAVPAMAAEYAYVPNTKSGTISVIDTSSDTVVKTLPPHGTLGKKLLGLAVTADGKRVLVVDAPSNGVIAVNAVTGKKIATIPTGKSPEGVEIAPGGDLAAACAEESNQAVLFNPKTLKPIDAIALQGQNPEHCVFSPDGKWLLASNENSNNIDVVDIAKRKSVALIQADGHPRGMGFTPDGKKVYVANESANLVQVLQVGTWKTIDKIPAELRTAGILVDPNGKRVYAANGGAGTVSVIDTSDDKIIASVKVGGRPWNMALTHDGKKLYVANGHSASVSVIDTATNKVIKTIPVGKFPWGVAIANMDDSSGS